MFGNCLLRLGSATTRRPTLFRPFFNGRVGLYQTQPFMASMIATPMRTVITPLPMTEMAQSRQASSRRISTKLLCDISGTRYYESNDEIDFAPTQMVNVFDENNVNIGLMAFNEGFGLAASLGKDIVLRNKNTDPPVVKIMDYKIELVKRVFKKLGKEIKGAEKKPKTI